MADTIKTNLGPVTAYADAKAHGYTGTREEFGQLLANAGLNLKAAETAKEGAEAAKQAAETAQQAAAENQKNAGTQAANAKASADTAKASADTAAGQANAAKESAAGAANSASAAKKSETNAGLSATAAANAEAAAKQAQNSAETAKADAETAKTAAGTSADAAAASAADAKKTLESIPDDYSTLSGKVDENANGIRELKEDIGHLSESKISKFYASNQGEAHLADSDNGKIMDMMVYGRCEQQTTTGKNLFDVTKTDNSILTTSGINVVKAERQGGLIEAVFSNSYQQLGIIIPDAERDTTYTIKLHQVNDKNDKIDIRAYTIKNNALLDQVKGTTIEGNIISMTFNIPAGTRSTVWFRPNGAYSAENKNACKFSNIQLEKGSEATSFEPYTGGIPSPNPEYPQEIKSVVNPTVKVSNEDGTESQTIALPYTLNAIPVSSGGNVTIDGQQYVSDRVVEKGGVFGIERNIREIHTNTKTMNNSDEYPGWNKVKGISDIVYYNEVPVGQSRKLFYASNFTKSNISQNNYNNNIVYYIKNSIGYSQSELIAKAIDIDMYIRLQDAIFEPLPEDIQVKLQTLATNYPVTNISVTSDQLDGYTVFNYPISLANGWNYVKQQLNDNRDYIYDMDLQSAEAYVNSEYAVALTELGV